MGLNKKNIIFFITSIVFCNSEINNLYNKGIDSFKNEKYSDAIYYFNEVLKINYISEELYYNLGNSYYLINNIPLSIWSYEKSLKINPFNEDAQFNLKLANLDVKDRISIPDPPYLLKLFRLTKMLLLPSGWILLWIVLIVIISSLFFLRKLFFINFFKKFEIILYTLIIILIFPGGFSIYDHFTINQGIILPIKVRVLSAPNHSSTELFNIHEGLKVDINDFENDWIEIELMDGKKGWIQLKQIKII